jgi:hypothetical protein
VIQITLNPQMADYTVILNHREVGLSRNNQMQIAAQNGDQLLAGEGGSIKAKVKQACILIVLLGYSVEPEFCASSSEFTAVVVPQAVVSPLVFEGVKDGWTHR